MVSHLRLEARQRYEQQICLSCITGLYGCRWKRYQRSTADTSLRERIWFLITICGIGFTVFWFYFWLVIRNDWDDINWYFYDTLGSWFDWFFLCLVLTCIIFSYAIILLILSLFHIIAGQEIYLHWIHKIIVVLILIGSIVVIILFSEIYPEEWVLFRLSLLIFGPFIQITAVVVLSALTWLIAGAWAKMRNMVLHIIYIILYISLLLFIYLCPLLLNSPCVATFEHLPQKPQMLGHRGAPEISPENTLVSFERGVEYSVYGFESDVHISYDGVPFLLHDYKLGRTTNVEDVFPDRKNEEAAWFNISDLKQLDAGSWYLDADPFRKASKTSEYWKQRYRNQTIPTYTEFLQYAAETNKTIIYDLFRPPDGHPYRENYWELVLNLTLASDIKHSLVWWLSGVERHKVMLRAPDFVQVSGKDTIQNLQSNDISVINEIFASMNEEEVRYYESYNISTNIYTVNSKWLFSLYWCISLPTVTSSACQELQTMKKPLWHMDPSTYLVIWIALDIASAVSILVMFIIQKHRYFGYHSAETISLASLGDHFNQDTTSTIKEKFQALLTRLRNKHMDYSPEVINLNSPRRMMSGSKKQDEIVLAPNENPDDPTIMREGSRHSVATADLANGEISTDESLESLPTLNHHEVRVDMG